MWKVGCSNGAEINDNASDSSSLPNRRFKPLMPKKAFSAMSFASSHRPYSPNDLLALNHHFAVERYKKEMGVHQQILIANATSRWNPTPEQLQALEDIYRRGTRTPSSEQIQQIASQLRQFGKIEGKNVFYWFQNHKARERQKRRRVSDPGSVKDHQGTDGSLTEPESGMRRTSYEVDQTKNWTLPSNCSTLSEETESIHRAAVGAESRSENGLINQSEGREKYQTAQKHDTCHLMELKTNIEKNVLSNRDFICRIYNEDYGDHGHCCEERSQTLELFPIRRDDDCNYVREVDYSVSNATPIKFFEFLPLKR